MIKLKELFLMDTVQFNLVIFLSIAGQLKYSSDTSMCNVLLGILIAEVESYNSFPFLSLFPLLEAAVLTSWFFFSWLLLQVLDTSLRV